MKKNKQVRSKKKLTPKNYTRKNLENAFMLKLLEYLQYDLSTLYSRRTNFISGKSTDYCRIGELKFNNHEIVKELKSPMSAFRLGVEFGINVSIDVYNSVMKRLYEDSDVSRLIKGEIDIQQLLKQSSIQKSKLLPQNVLRQLRKYKKIAK